MNKLKIVSNYKHYFIDLLILAFPLLIGNLGHTLIGASDILIVAKYNIDTLASISIANSIIFTILIFGLGILLAVSIILSNKRGKKEGIKKYLSSTLFFAFILALIFMGICYLTNILIPYCGFDENLVYDIREYIKIVSFSIFGMFFFEGIKQFLQSYEIVKFPNMMLLCAVIINILFDIIFVFGWGIIPAMGAKGAAVATFLVRTFMGIVMFIYIFRFINLKSPIYLDYMKNIIKIGSPIGFALLFEFLAFNIITILVGRESGILAATHNILNTISTSTFMVPLSIATALSVKVAYYYGAYKKEEIKNYSCAGIIMGVGFMMFAGIIMAIFPREIISLFTTNEEVMEIALPLVIIAAMYQIFDGLQTVMGGILKGFKLTSLVSKIVLIGYWIIGMPVAIILVYYYNLSLKGYWIALAVSLFSMGIIQAVAAKYKFEKI